MIVKCLPTTDSKKPCPMITTCMARLTDRTITGCGVPLAYVGLIRPQDIQVEHTICVNEREEVSQEINYN